MGGSRDSHEAGMGDERCRASHSREQTVGRHHDDPVRLSQLAPAHDLNGVSGVQALVEVAQRGARRVARELRLDQEKRLPALGHEEVDLAPLFVTDAPERESTIRARERPGEAVQNGPSARRILRRSRSRSHVKVPASGSRSRLFVSVVFPTRRGPATNAILRSARASRTAVAM